MKLKLEMCNTAIVELDNLIKVVDMPQNRETIVYFGQKDDVHEAKYAYETVKNVQIINE